MGVMGRTLACLVAAVSGMASAVAAEIPPQWQIFADCSAAYRANWQDRLTDPTRRPEMATMIHDESEQYKRVAIGHYQAERTASKEEASRTVDRYLEANLERFIAMDKAGTLEAYIDNCPQPEERN